MMKHFYLLGLLAFGLASCATPEKSATPVRYGTPVRAAPSIGQASPSLRPNRRLPVFTNAENRQQPTNRNAKIRSASVSLATAATAPLDDLNLRRKVAPKTLQELGYIYQANPRPTCAAIARELYILGQALGELDADDAAIIKTTRQQRTEMASDTTLDAVRSTSSGLIPFSGVLRAASGANKAKRIYDKQYDHGRRRRAFLKGYALGIGCRSPIAPKTVSAPIQMPMPQKMHKTPQDQTAPPKRRSNRY